MLESPVDSEQRQGGLVEESRSVISLISSIAPILFPLPLLVFLAELCVVTIGTIKIIFVARGMKLLAPLLGFFEVSIWLFAISQILQNLSDVGLSFAFAGGFTAGNFLGVIIEKKLAIGSVVVRVITPRDVTDLIGGLHAADYGVTTIDAQGATGPVKIVFTIVRRKELEHVVSIIKAFDANAFYSVDDLQSLQAGVFPVPKGRLRGLVPVPLRLFRSAA
jgi:uncharacterized protein YebE (UPF0316 family)